MNEKLRNWVGTGLVVFAVGAVGVLGGVKFFGDEGDSNDLVQISAPADAAVGQLVIIDATKSKAKSFKWIVVPETSNFLVIEDGRKAVFSEGRPGQYRFYIAGAAGDQVDAETHTIDVGGSAPSPVPGINQKVKAWVAQVNSAGKKSEQSALSASFSGVAAQIAAGVLKTPDDVIKSTAVANRGALGSSIDSWKPFADSLRTELNQLSQAGKLETMEQHADLWRQISAALGSN